MAKNDKLNLKNAIQILDLLVKIYLNNIIFAPLSSLPILILISRNMESPTMQDFVFKFLKIALSMYYALEKKKKPKEMTQTKKNFALKQDDEISESAETQIINSQKRALIIEIIKQIFYVKHEEFNEKMLPLIAHTNIQIKNFSKKNNKGLCSILSLYGSLEKILQKFENEYLENKALEQLKKQEEEKVKNNIDNSGQNENSKLHHQNSQG